MPNPTVSIIMTAYNAESTIERAISSVQNQTYNNWELLVIDDGSTDNTAQILHKIQETANDSRLIFVYGEPNVGLSYARNKGLDRASGDWITFLDSDDEITPTRISSAVESISSDTDIIICRHMLVQTDGSQSPRGISETEILPGYRVAEMILIESATNYAWDKLFRRSALGDLRYVKITRVEDKIFSIDAALKARNVRFIENIGVIYYVSQNSLTWTKLATVEDTEYMMTLLAEIMKKTDCSEQKESALKACRVIAYLAVSNQAIFLNKSTKPYRDHYSSQDILATLKHRPVLGLAGALLKTIPNAYSILYRSYTNRRYGLS